MTLVRLLVALIIVSIPAVAQQTESHFLVINHATVIDMTGTPPRDNMTVIIEGDRIKAIGVTNKIRVPRTAQIIDAQGLFLIPGLWDMHVHFTEVARTFPMFIANGVIGVRNVGGDLEQLLTWRAQVASGKLLGPRIVTCGPILDGPDPAVAGVVAVSGRKRTRRREPRRAGADVAANTGHEQVAVRQADQLVRNVVRIRRNVDPGPADVAEGGVVRPVLLGVERWREGDSCRPNRGAAELEP